MSFDIFETEEDRRRRLAKQGIVEEPKPMEQMTTREAVAAAFDRQHPYGGYEKIKTGLGDFSYYNENLYAPKNGTENTQTGQPTQLQTGAVSTSQSQSPSWQSSTSQQQPIPVPNHKPRYAELDFDGQNLSWLEHGKKTASWPAMSGNENNQGYDKTHVVNKGPIPEGKWHVNQDQHQNFFKNQSIGSMIGGLNPVKKQGTWPRSVFAWGTDRIWLNPAEGTDAKGRTNLSIHGGTSLGSAGCVDLANNMDEFLEMYRKYGRDMFMNVKYPR